MAPPVDLAQTLADLQAQAPGLFSRATDPLELTQALRTQYDAFEDEWEERVAAAEAEVEAARTALGQLDQAADEAESAVREAMTTLDVVVDHHDEAIQAELAELVQKMTAAGDSMNHLQSTLVQAGKDAQEQEEQVRQAAGDLTAAARTAQDTLEAAAATVLQEMDDLDTEVATATTGVNADLAAFAAALTAAADKARGELTAALDQIGVVLRDHATAAEAAATQLREARTDQLARVQGAVTQEVATEVGGAADGAVQALDSLDSRADAASDEAKASRPDLEAAIDSAAEQGGKLDKALDLIEETANVVGVLWPG